MTLSDLTALMSRVGRQKPELVRDRNVALFIQACIEEAKIADGQRSKPTAEVV